MKTQLYGCCVAAVTFLFPTSSLSEANGQMPYSITQAGYVQDTGASNRIESADKLRTITQEVAAATCFLHNNVEAPLAVEVAQHGLDQFDLLTTALLDGDEALGIIGGEQNRRARAMIEDFRTDWMPVQAAVAEILLDPTNASAAEEVYGRASDMLDASMSVLTKVESVHVTPSELLYADAMLLDVAGRQAMMTQRLSFLACKKWSGAGNEAYDELLRTATEQYIFGFEALLNGAPALGIVPPPNEDIANALGEANADFQIVKAKLNELIETRQLEEDRIGDLYRILNAKLVQMENVAHLYAQHAKRVY